MISTLLPLFCLLGQTPLPGAVASATHPATRPSTVAVMVVVTALASPTSVVKLNFYNAADCFLKDGRQYRQLIVRPEGKTSITVPIDLPPGEWAVALTQDTNDNDHLDTNFLGIPTEPYAFSNNVRPRFAAPKFEECKFVVSEPGTVVNIALKPK